MCNDGKDNMVDWPEGQNVRGDSQSVGGIVVRHGGQHLESCNMNAESTISYGGGPEVMEIENPRCIRPILIFSQGKKDALTIADRDQQRLKRRLCDSENSGRIGSTFLRQIFC